MLNFHCAERQDFNTLIRLADDLYSRFEAQGSPSDLSLCIVRYRSALTLARTATTLSSDAWSQLLSNLANALSIRFRRHGDITDLNHSVECHLAALNLRPPGHPGRAKTLSDFATALLARYGELGMQKDIELAIKYFNTALPILPPGGRLMPHMDYASALYSRFQCSGDISDLNNAIYQYRTIVDSSPPENKPTSYCNLANALLSRFKLGNDPKDLELSIEHLSVALGSMSEGHPDRLFALSCLSTALIRRFESFGDAEDIETAVKNLKSTLVLRSAQDALQHVAFFDLADALVLRYKLHSDLPDLELAIKHYRTALDLLPIGYENEGIFLDNLGNALFLRFSSLGSLDDLDEAIQKYFCALEIHSEDLTRRVATLDALGACLDVRFERFGDHQDLHTAIDLYDEALIGASQDHPSRGTVLTRSASRLERRFRLFGGIADLHRSISYCREALELLAPDHPDRVISYRTLASSLLLRFEDTGDEIDLDEASLVCSTCENMQYISDPSRAACNLLLARISKTRVLPWDLKDLEPIFQHLCIAKDLCTLSNPLISDVYAELASAHYLRFLRKQRPCDLHEAYGLHELSMNVASGSLWPALRASLQWVNDAEIYGHRSGVDAYRCALRLVNRHILGLRSAELRQRLARKHGPGLAYGGASFALRFESPVEAIEALEGGRSVLWSQLVRGKTCLDELRLTGELGGSLADDFERLSFQLKCLSGASEASKDTKPLLKEREAVVAQIRRLEGFGSFLRSASFSDLEKAAIDGPIVVLNANQHTCDALIVLSGMLPIHVPLSRTTPNEISRMARRFRELSGNIVRWKDEMSLEHLLVELWNVVVSPIIQHLLPHSPKGSRLWWCPTGVFTSIPLHAAGRCRQGAPSLSRVYVSSYAPTLEALIRARSTPAHEAPRPRCANKLLKRKTSKQPLANPMTLMTPTIVAIGHTASDETSHELDHLRNCIPPSVPFRRIEGEEVTSDAVRAAFREPVWLHLACPASLNVRLPCRSGFTTKDGRLSLYDISGARPLAEFAFLSGQCNRWEDTEQEERMHLAASLQYSGIRSVIGTLWPVDDEVMQRVTAAFYEKVIPKAGGSMHYTNTAQSLHEALTAVGTGVPLAQKIAFVHVGA